MSAVPRPGMLALAIMIVLAFQLGCSGEEQGKPSRGDIDASKPALRAEATISPTRNHRVSGTVAFESRDGRTRMVADITNLPPGRHGFHVHEYGDCSAPDAASAGAHFAFETGTPPADQVLGNLGELVPDAGGRAHLERVVPEAELAGPRSIISKAVVIHASGNDSQSPPDGNAGARIGCGVIEVGR